VIKTELGDLSNTVRAKRGQKLPVVLSPEEVQSLFKHVETTMIYTHVVRDMVSVPQSPLDNLYSKNQ